MKIIENVYQLSGVPYGTNSNSYVIHAGDQLILIDAGFTDYQFEVIMESLKFWGLDHLPITHTFITHCHFDHAGNAHLARKLGSKILIGPSDAEGVETGDIRTIGHMFNKEFVPCKVDTVLQDGDIFQIGNIEIKAIHVPGHTQGAMMFQTQIKGKTLLFMGDFIALEPAAPLDDVKVLLAWQGGPDYSNEDYKKSIARTLEFDIDILLPGHYYVFYGDCNRIFKMANEKALEELK